MTKEEAIRILASSCIPGSKQTEALETLIPELAESEDERMMREFNDWLCEEIECLTNDLRDEEDRRTLNMLCYVLTKVKDWFEKQKEQKPSIFPPGLGEVHWNPIPSGKDVHKWTLPKDFEEAVYKVANFISPFDNQEELRKVSHRFAEQLLSLAKKELDKPAEWSEEDESELTAVIYCVSRAIKASKDENERNSLLSAKKWLQDKLSFHIKSLRPQKLDASKLENFDPVDVLNRIKTEWPMAWEKVVWKPSEEQMEALKNSAYDSYQNGDGPALRELYEQLKKL